MNALAKLTPANRLVAAEAIVFASDNKGLQINVKMEPGRQVGSQVAGQPANQQTNKLVS